jgi:hypothetical protein
MVGRTTTRGAQAYPIFMSHRSRVRAPMPGLLVLVLLLAVAIALRLL